MMMKKPITVFVILLLSALINAQGKPRMYVYPLIAEGFSDEETQNIESVLFSYFTEQGDITLIDEADYTLTAYIRLDENSRFLDIDIVNLGSGELFSFSYPFKDFRELVLKARTLIPSVFLAEQKMTAPAARRMSGERLSPEIITGTWRSGGGVQMIRLERNGTGVLFFTSGVAMKLSYVIEGNVLKVEQNSPNHERFYHYLPQKAAQELSELAEPMRWEFSLFEQGTMLRGTVTFTEAICEGDTLTALNPGKSDLAEWQKNR